MNRKTYLDYEGIRQLMKGQDDTKINFLGNYGIFFRAIMTQTRRKDSSSDAACAIRIVHGEGETFLVYPGDSLAYDGFGGTIHYSPGEASFSDPVRALLKRLHLPQKGLFYHDNPVSYSLRGYCAAFGSTVRLQDDLFRQVSGGEVLVLFQPGRWSCFVEQVVVRTQVDKKEAARLLNALLTALMNREDQSAAEKIMAVEERFWSDYNQQRQEAYRAGRFQMAVAEQEALQQRRRLQKLYERLAELANDGDCTFSFGGATFVASLVPGCGNPADHLVISSQNGSSAIVGREDAMQSGLLEAWVGSSVG